MRNLQVAFVLGLAVCAPALTSAQTVAEQARPAHSAAPAAAAASVPSDYVIGPDDRLSIVFWHDKDMSAGVVVRPDGKITLPLLNEMQAAGLTPEQLRLHLVEAASKFVQEPNATVVVEEIRSRKVFITGSVAKPGTYPLVDDMTVVQLIAVAGGLQDYADAKKIVIMRTEAGRPHYFKFNYNDVVNQKRPAQNILLRPGDTVLVP